MPLHRYCCGWVSISLQQLVGVGFSHCHGVILSTQAVDKRIPAINPHMNLERAVVVA